MSIGGKLVKALRSECAVPWTTIALLGMLFLWSIHLRSPWFGKMHSNGHHWVTAHASLAVGNWVSDGPWNIGFLNLFVPADPICADLSRREVYVSYPPGHLIVPYLIGCVNGNKARLANLMGWNLASHFLICVLLAFTVRHLARHCRHSRVALLGCALLPGAFFMFSKGPSYWMQNTYFADQAVMLPFAAVLFLESIGHTGIPSQQAIFRRSLLWGAVFYGVLTDYLFVFVVAIAMLMKVRWCCRPRLLCRSALKPWEYWTASLAGIALYAWQLYHFGLFPGLVGKFMQRAGISEEGASVLRRKWMEIVARYAADQYGPGVFWVCGLVTLAVVVVNVWPCVMRSAADERDRTAFRVMLLALIPCLLQIYVLKNHSVVHDFSVLKLGIPLALSVGLLGDKGFALVARLLRGTPDERFAAVVPTLIVIPLAWALFRNGPTRMFPPLSEQYRYAQLAEVFCEVAPNDLVVSQVVAIESFSPMDLATTKKVVHRVASLAEANQLLSTCECRSVYIFEDVSLTGDRGITTCDDSFAKAPVIRHCGDFILRRWNGATASDSAVSRQ